MKEEEALEAQIKKLLDYLFKGDLEEKDILNIIHELIVKSISSPLNGPQSGKDEQIAKIAQSQSKNILKPIKMSKIKFYILAFLDLLPEYLNIAKVDLINLDASFLNYVPPSIEEGVQQVATHGVTAFYWLAKTEKGLKILAAYPNLLNKANVDAGPQSGPSVGKTVLWRLARLVEEHTYTLFSKYPDLLIKGNLNAAPLSGRGKGETVLWLLVLYDEGQEVIKEILNNHPNFLKNANLDAPQSNGGVQVSVLWEFSHRGIGRKILAAHPYLLEKGNLDIENDPGETVLWMLTKKSEEGDSPDLTVFKKHPHLLKKGNLDAGPPGYAEEPNLRKTVLWQLANEPEGQAILKAHPELLMNTNLLASPSHEMDPDFGKSVLEKLPNSFFCIETVCTFATIFEAQPILKNHMLRIAFDSNNVGLIKLLLLLDTDPGLSMLSIDEKKDLTFLKAKLEKVRFSAVSLLYTKIDGCDRLPQELLMQIFYETMVLSHPELKFIKPIAYKLMEKCISVVLDNQLADIAFIAVRKYTQNKGLERFSRDIREELFSLVKGRLIAKRNRHQLPAAANLSYPFRELLYNKIKACELITTDSVDGAIGRAVKEYQNTYAFSNDGASWGDKNVVLNGPHSTAARAYRQKFFKRGEKRAAVLPARDEEVDFKKSRLKGPSKN